MYGLLPISGDTYKLNKLRTRLSCMCLALIQTHLPPVLFRSVLDTTHKRVFKHFTILRYNSFEIYMYLDISFTSEDIHFTCTYRNIILTHVIHCRNVSYVPLLIGQLVRDCLWEYVSVGSVGLFLRLWKDIYLRCYFESRSIFCINFSLTLQNYPSNKGTFLTIIKIGISPRISCE